MMKTIHTVAGKLQFVSFKNFINKYVPRGKVSGEYHQYNKKVTNSWPLASSSFEDNSLDEETTSYKRKVAILHKNDSVALKFSILNDSEFFNGKNCTNNIDLIEGAAVKAAEEFQNPTLLVSLGSRRFLLVDTELVRFVENEKGMVSLIFFADPIYFDAPMSNESHMKRYGYEPLDLVRNKMDTPEGKAFGKMLLKKYHGV